MFLLAAASEYTPEFQDTLDNLFGWYSFIIELCIRVVEFDMCLLIGAFGYHLGFQEEEEEEEKEQEKETQKI